MTSLRTVRVIFVQSYDTVLIAGQQRNPVIREEQICAGHADVMWVLPKDDKFVRVFLLTG